MREIAPTVVNRAIGSQKRTKDEMYFDWTTRTDAYWKEQFQRIVETGKHPNDAWMELIKHDREMQKLHEEQVKRNGTASN